MTQFEKIGASPFGVVDMVGNVWEWCLTDYEKKTNEVESASTYRVLRGGSWYDGNPDYFAVSDRYRDFPVLRYFVIGFRAALSLER